MQKKGKEFDEETTNVYEIAQSITDMLGIDRVEGSLCIKETRGYQDLGDCDFFKVAEFNRAKNDPSVSAETLRAYKQELFNGFDPSCSVKCVIDYPCNEVVFDIPPYVYSRGGVSLEYFPVGYVCWMIAKEYKKIFAEPEKFGVWGHEIDDLQLEFIELTGPNQIKLVVSS